MKAQILLIGAGRSSTVLISYLLEIATRENCLLRVVSKHIVEDLKQFESGQLELIEEDVFSSENLSVWVKESRVVVSMLPAHLHHGVAAMCLMHKKHFVNASYLSKEIKAMDSEVREKGLVFINECGLDPGLDHMSAMKEIDAIREKGGHVEGFESFAGGLIAPDSDNNPWGYKLTWNPRNVVLAGQGAAAKFKQEGTYKYIPYQQLFRRTEVINVPGYGNFEGYANRNSLKYQDLYGLEDAKTIYRGTLRQLGFCKAWSKLVRLGMTDDTYRIENSRGMTYRAFTNLFLAYHPSNSVEAKFQKVLGIDQDDFSVIEKINYLGLFSEELIPVENGTPAEVLQELLERKWSLSDHDKDMIVMWHKINYTINGERQEMQLSLVVEGDDQRRTAMAKTVGLPLGIVVKLILDDRIAAKGVMIPTSEEIYGPVLKELEEHHKIKFQVV